MGCFCSICCDQKRHISKSKIRRQSKIQNPLICSQQENELNQNCLKAEELYNKKYSEKIYSRHHEIYCNYPNCQYDKKRRHVHMENDIIILKDSQIYCKKCNMIITLVEETLTSTLYKEIKYFSHCNTCCNTYENLLEIKEIHDDKSKNSETLKEIRKYCNRCAPNIRVSFSS